MSATVRIEQDQLRVLVTSAAGARLAGSRVAVVDPRDGSFLHALLQDHETRPDRHEHAIDLAPLRRAESLALELLIGTDLSRGTKPLALSASHARSMSSSAEAT